jgi:hypothetical protein
MSELRELIRAGAEKVLEGERKQREEKEKLESDEAIAKAREEMVCSYMFPLYCLLVNLIASALLIFSTIGGGREGHEDDRGKYSGLVTLKYTNYAHLHSTLLDSYLPLIVCVHRTRKRFPPR